LTGDIMKTIDVRKALNLSFYGDRIWRITT